MSEKTLTVKNNVGIHARPATLLTSTANKFTSDVQLEYKGKNVNVKSIMGLMSLGIPGGAEVVVRVTGPDETQALAAISELFETGFGEA